MILLGILFRQIMRFQEALAKLGRNMSRAENAGVPPIMYQNSITPPWLTNTWITLAVGVLALLVAAWHFGGLTGAIIAILLLLASMFVSGLVSLLLSRPNSATYHRLAFHTLANREANYRRDGDLDRANAAKHFQSLMLTLVGNDMRST